MKSPVSSTIWGGSMQTYAVETDSISINFGAVQALKDVEFKLKAGEIRGLVGKNGAGKSTLVKVLNGIHHQKAGSLRIFGNEITKATPPEVRRQFLSMIYQEFSLIPEMTVIENVFLNVEPMKGPLVDDKTTYGLVKNFFDSMEVDIEPHEKVKNLNTSDMQFVEISKAVLQNKRILLMDEPTAALEADQTDKLFRLIRKLKDRGISIVLITHHLHHIMQLCDSVTVLRDGQVVLDEQTENIDLQDVIYHMLGDKGFSERRRKFKAIESKKPLLVMQDVRSKNSRYPISLELYSGEVLGLAGLKGSGRTEILNTLFGIDPALSGSITLNGREVILTNPNEAYSSGLSLIPENRHTQGLSLMHSVYFNTILPILDRLGQTFVDDRQGKSLTNHFVERLNIRTDDILASVSNLSGGNQQKVVIAKSLANEPKVMLMDDPTYGVDIHAKSEIMNIIDEFTSQGNGVILVSSDLKELLQNCDRILIVKEQRIVQEIRDVLATDVTEEELENLIQQQREEER